MENKTNLENIIGKRIRIKKKDEFFEGILVNVIKKKNNEENIKEENFLLLKLDNGYNVGFNEKNTDSIELLEEKYNKEREGKTRQSQIKKINYKSNKTIYLFHTGGTIASRIDYKTGAVSAQFSPEEILELFPELSGDYNIKTKIISNIFSEDMGFKTYNLLIKEIKNQVTESKNSKENLFGIIITHGTDTMHYTSSALNFALRNLPFPIILVGSQRSSDRPSTDSKMNLVCATKFLKYIYLLKDEDLKTKLNRVFICMHGSINDDFCYLLDGFNVRKMHTSRRDAFKSVNRPFVAKVPFNSNDDPVLNEQFLKFLNDCSTEESKKEKSTEFKTYYFNENLKIGILYAHPNLISKEILNYKNFDGLIIAGTGLGHIGINKTGSEDNSDNLSALNELIKKGVKIAITSQTIYGRINHNVYSTGRILKENKILGHLNDMTIETGFIKLAFLLSNFKDNVDVLYSKNLNGEINYRIKEEDFI